jgi:serine/threonine protein phosphatase PrpC
MTKLKIIYNSKITCNDNTYNGITEINDYENKIEITSTSGDREYQEDYIYHLINDNIQYLSQNTREKIFTESLKYFDKSLSKKKFKEPSGTTLLSVMSIGNEITIANLSDSYIYLVTKKNNEYKCILLNTPFNLSNSSELNRVTNLGAKFDNNNESPKYIQIQNNNKIFKINPTRTIGDYLIKEKLKDGCISNNPEIIHINLNDEQYGGYDEYHLIAATDGLTLNCAEIAEIFSKNDKLITIMLIKEELSKICSHDNLITIHIPLHPECKKNGVIFTLCDGHLGREHSKYMSKNYTNRISQLVNTLSNKDNKITDNFITKTIDYEDKKNELIQPSNSKNEYLLDNRSKSLPISSNLKPNINKKTSLQNFNWKSLITTTKKNTNNTLVLFE